MAKQLSGKQRSWISHYVGDSHFNATDAARRAGYSDPVQSGWENKTNQDIVARVDEILDAVALRGNEILGELTAVATAPTKHFMQVVIPEKVDEDGDVISEMVVRLDYSAKMKALELLGKNRRMFSEKVELSGTFTFTDLARMVAHEEEGEGSAE